MRDAVAEAVAAAVQRLYVTEDPRAADRHQTVLTG
jgi:hypothetical protein